MNWTKFCGLFCEILERHAHPALPFLLVIDTFEIVQYDTLAVAGLDLFLRTLAHPFGTVWPRIRIVMSGRTEVEGLSLRVIPLRLKPLPERDAYEAVDSLARARGVPLTQEQAGALARLTRGRPIDIVLGIRLICETRPEQRNEVLDAVRREVAETSADFAAGPLTDTFVTGILYKRFIEHIQDRRIQQLAVPGFVVRLITPEIIRDVMAPASRRAAVRSRSKAARSGSCSTGSAANSGSSSARAMRCVTGRMCARSCCRSSVRRIPRHSAGSTNRRSDSPQPGSSRRETAQPPRQHSSRRSTTTFSSATWRQPTASGAMEWPRG